MADYQGMTSVAITSGSNSKSESYSMARPNAEAIGDDQDLIKSAAQCRHLSLLFKIFTKLSCLHVGRDPRSGDLTSFSGPRKYFRVHCPWMRGLSRQKRRCCGLFLRVYLAWFVVSGIYTAVIVFLMLRHEMLEPYGQLVLIRKDGSPASNKSCAHKNDTRLSRPDKASELFKLEELVDFAKIPFYNIPSFNLFNHCILLMMWANLVVVSVVLRNDTFLIEPLSFIANPMEHKALIHKRVDTVSKQLLVEHRRRSKRVFKTPSSRHQAASYDSGKLDALPESDDIASVLRYIVKMELVQPACVGKTCMRRLVAQAYFLSYYMMGSYLISGLWSQLAESVQDLYFITQMRLNRIECEIMFGGHGVWLGKHMVRLPPLSREEHSVYVDYLNHYNDYDIRQMVSSRMALIFGIEFGKKFSLITMLEVVNFSHIIYLCVYGIWVILVIYTTYLTYYSVWSEQVNEQLKLSHQLLETRLETIDSNSKHNPGDSTMISEISIQLMVTYINFELFHRTYKRTQRYFNTMVSVFLAVALCACGLCYVNGKKGDGFNNFVMIVFSNIFVMIGDYFLIKIASMERQILCQYRSIVRLVTLGAHNKLELTASIAMWRRQLLTDAEFESLFSPKIFGLKVSYTNFIGMNLYILGIWLLLIKNSIINVLGGGGILTKLISE